MMLLNGTCLCIQCLIHSEVACAGSIAGFDTLDTAGVECIAVI